MSSLSDLADLQHSISLADIQEGDDAFLPRRIWQSAVVCHCRFYPTVTRLYEGLGSFRRLPDCSSCIPID
jgi:hypothetical protein